MLDALPVYLRTTGSKIMVVLALAVCGALTGFLWYRVESPFRLYLSRFWVPYTLDLRPHANNDASFFPAIYGDEVIALIQYGGIVVPGNRARIGSVSQVQNSHMMLLSIKAPDQASAEGLFAAVVNRIEDAARVRHELNKSLLVGAIEVLDKQIKDLEVMGPPRAVNDIDAARLKDAGASNELKLNEPIAQELVRLRKLRALFTAARESRPSGVVTVDAQLVDGGPSSAGALGYIELGMTFGALLGIALVSLMSLKKFRRLSAEAA